MRTLVFSDEAEIIKYLQAKLAIYESRFLILDGCIQSIMVRDKNNCSVPIGYLEKAYMDSLKEKGE